MSDRNDIDEQCRERVKEVEAELATKDSWTHWELTKLANYILQPELQSQNWDKAKRQEYPVLSRRQEIRREVNDRKAGRDLAEKGGE